MAQTAARIALSFQLCVLLTHTWYIHGWGDTKVFYRDEVEAYVGDNVSLPCVTEHREGMSVTQLEWRKRGDHGEEKLVVFSPGYAKPHAFWPDASLTLEWNGSSGGLKGSSLELRGVQRSDSGVYLCDLAVFPDGSIKKQTHLRVKDPWLSAAVIQPLGPVSEREEVRILCSSGPQTEGYKLSRTSENPASTLWSANGTFVLANVTRESAGVYSCHPQWPSDVPRLHDNQRVVRLHVSYLDRVECDRNGTIEVGAGDNVTVHCDASASSDVRYRWTKDGRWVSDGRSLELWGVQVDQAGGYTLSVSTQNNHSLHTEFTVTLLPATTGSDTEGQTTGHSTPQTVRDNQNQSGSVANPTHTTPPSTWHANTSTNGTSASDRNPNPAGATTNVYHVSNVTSSSENRRVSRATQSGPELSVATPRSKVVDSFVQNSTSGQSNDTRRPFDRSGSASPSTGAVEPRASSTPWTWTEENDNMESVPEMSTPRGDTEIRGVIVESDASDGRVHVVWIVFLILTLLLMAMLYRRHVVRRRLDLPPPFKPPPPPARYTHVRRASPTFT